MGWHQVVSRAREGVRLVCRGRGGIDSGQNCRLWLRSGRWRGWAGGVGTGLQALEAHWELVKVREPGVVWLLHMLFLYLLEIVGMEIVLLSFTLLRGVMYSGNNRR